MFKLTVFLAGQKIQNFDFKEKQFVTIGREKGCEVHIDNIGVSRKHCQIEKKERIYVLRDLNSGNGTFVSGRRVTTYNLNSGDEIMLGKYTVLFERPEGDDEGTDVLMKPKESAAGAPQVGATLQMDAGQVEAMQRQRATRVRAHLLAVGTPGAKPTFLDRSLYVIGKADSANIKATGWRVAPKHAILFRDEAGFQILHVSAKGPTLVNNRPVEQQRLRDGDVIEISGHKFQFMSPQGSQKR